MAAPPPLVRSLLPLAAPRVARFSALPLPSSSAPAARAWHALAQTPAAGGDAHAPPALGTGDGRAAPPTPRALRDDARGRRALPWRSRGFAAKAQAAKLADDTPVRVAREDGTSAIIPYADAVAEADGSKLTLVCVAEQASPPVFRLVDVAAKRVEEYRKERDSKSRQVELRRAQSVKEVRINAKAAENDALRARDNAIGFLNKGYRVKVTVQVRRNDPPDAATKMMERFTTIECARLIMEPQRQGGRHVALLALDAKKAAAVKENES